MRNLWLTAKRSQVESEQTLAVFVRGPVEPELQPASFPRREYSGGDAHKHTSDFRLLHQL